MAVVRRRPARGVSAPGVARRAAARTRDERRPGADTLPAWPVTLPLATYLLAWVLGPGDLVWVLAAVGAAATWVGVRRLEVPATGWVWVAHVAWATVALAMTDTPGRLIGALYRLALLAAAGAFAHHVYNARTRLPLGRVLTAVSAFLACVTIGGYLALLLPELTLHTPLGAVLPAGLKANELVGEMAVRRTTQYEAGAAGLPRWLSVRPSAPFIYTNTWGNVYSLVLPLSLVDLVRRRGRPSWWALLALVLASLVPAAATLNRGMLIGLGVVAAWTALQTARRGRLGPLLVGAVGVAGLAVAWVVSPMDELLTQRLSTTSSTGDRYALYRATIDALRDSPVLGFGAPRPASSAWLPSLGTQGQLWTEAFSYGWVGAGLFIGFLLLALGRAWRRTDLLGAVLGGIVLATLVESFYYGMMTGLVITLTAVALLERGDRLEVLSSRAPRRRPARRRATGRLSGRA